MSTVDDVRFLPDFPTDAIVKAFSVIKGGKVDKPSAEILAKCAVVLELWALGCYFGAAPLMGQVSVEGDMSDEEANSLLEHYSESDEPGIVGSPALLPPGKALQLAFWIAKLAISILL